MSEEDECDAPDDAEIARSASPSAWAELSSLGEAAQLSYQKPLSGDLALRVWYHRKDLVASRFCPKQSAYLGPRIGEKRHQGVDLFARNRSATYAVASGVIAYNVVDDPQGWGNHAYLYFSAGPDRYILVYSHLHEDSAFAGQKKVKAGDSMPVFTGCSGNAGGGDCDRTHACEFAGEKKTPIEDHLHLELLKLNSNGDIEKRVDPVVFFGWAVGYATDQRCDDCLERTQIL